VSVFIFKTAAKFHLYDLHLPFYSPLVDLDKNTHRASTVFPRILCKSNVMDAFFFINKVLHLTCMTKL
jgi:hypothetical protein